MLFIKSFYQMKIKITVEGFDDYFSVFFFLLVVFFLEKFKKNKIALNYINRQYFFFYLKKCRKSEKIKINLGNC